MNCGYGEKLILFLYGEAGGMAAEVEAHLAGCPSCRAELAVLKAAGNRLAPVEPPGELTAGLMRAARAAASSRRGFSFRWGEALLSGALASVMAFFFAFSGRTATADLAWNSGLDTRLDSVEYSVYQAEADLSAGSGDWEYGLSAVEDEGLELSGNV